MRSDGQVMGVGAVEHHTERPATVYNLEVADWHTYLVSWWMFVVHNATICLRKIGVDLYKKLRKKTPTAKIRELVNKKYVKGMPDPALPGRTIDKALHADHIVPMDKITRLNGFDKLSEAQQLEVLNYEKNFIGLSESANTSKGAKTFQEWVEHKGLGVKVDDKFRQEMIQRGNDLEPELQGIINKFLRTP